MFELQAYLFAPVELTVDKWTEVLPGDIYHEQPPQFKRLVDQCVLKCWRLSYLSKDHILWHNLPEMSHA